MVEPTIGTTHPSGADGDPDLEVGSTVGEYQVEGKLGQGGFGAVFKAVHPLIGKTVAIKVLSTMFSANREMVSRFVAEARAVNQIKHRNIIDIFSFGQLDDGRHYYVMEYVEGEPLDRRIARGPISLVESLPILRGVARALDAAHAKGIAHRDLKAENIFLANDDDGPMPLARHVFPKLLDFGIAKLMGSEDGGIAHKTRTGAPMGTPYYMSPEQTKGRNVDHRTDLYAFGVLIYVMLTTKFPLDGEDYMTILMRQVSDEPIPASSVVSLGDAGERIDQVISWLMRKNPLERPPDLITAVRALEEVAGIAAPAGQSAPVTIPSHVTVMRSSAQTAQGGPATSLSSASGPTVASGSMPAASATAPTSMVDSIPPPARSKRGLVIGIVAALAVIGVVIAVVASGRSPTAGSGSAPLAAVDAAMPVAMIDAAPVVPTAIDAAPAIDAAADKKLVTITLDGAPAGAPVKIGGEVVGTAPAVQIPQGTVTDNVLLVITADGYEPFTLRVTPDRDQTRKVWPKPLKKPVGTGSGKTGSGSAKPGSGSKGSDEPPTDGILVPTFPDPKKGN